MQATIVTKEYITNLLNEAGFATSDELLSLSQRLETELEKKADNEHNHSTEQISDYDAYTKAQTDQHISEQIAQIVADAPESFDTLKELSDWIFNHADEASTMNSAIEQNTQAIKTNAQNIELNASAINSVAAQTELAIQNLNTSIENAKEDLQSQLETAKEQNTQALATKATNDALAESVETLNNRINLMASTQTFESAKTALQSAIDENSANIELNASGIAENLLNIEANAQNISANSLAISQIANTMMSKTEIVQAIGDSMEVNQTGATELAVISLEKGTYLVFVETTVTGANYAKAEIFGNHFLLNMPTQAVSVFACKTISKAKDLSVNLVPIETFYDTLRITGTKVTAIKIA